jgi:hypothetical protein
MSDSGSENNLSYEDVAKIADIISKSGNKIRVDEVRKEIGYGDHAQIVFFLRKWQSSNIKGDNRVQAKTIAKPQNNRQKPQKQNSNQFYQYDDASSYTFQHADAPFCLDTFLKQSDTVKALFMAICCIKQEKCEVQEQLRRLKASSLSFYKQSDRDIRRIKMEARDKVKALSSEFAKVYVIKEQEMNRLKDQNA